MILEKWLWELGSCNANSYGSKKWILGRSPNVLVCPDLLKIEIYHIYISSIFYSHCYGSQQVQLAFKMIKNKHVLLYTKL